MKYFALPIFYRLVWTTPLVGILAGEATLAAASQVCVLPAMKAGERPDVGDAPTVVSVGLWLLDVTEINDVEQFFSADFLLYQSWIDSRLDGLAGCRFPLDRVWSPQLSFLNSGRVLPSFPDRASIREGGKQRKENSRLDS